MTTPSVIPSIYTDSPTALLNAPTGQGDSPRLVERTVTVPDGTTTGTIIGLVPFNKGATIDYGASLAVDDLDTATSVTLDWGYVYIDNDTVTNINDGDAFADGATTAQAGGILRPTATAGATFKATADGWIAVTTGGASTTTEGDITFKGVIAYGINGNT